MIELLKTYDREAHLKRINVQSNFELEYLFSKKWKKDEDIPYVLKTHLLDSYYCLPERPDMAFTFLWKCINNIYSSYHRKNSVDVEIGDAILLDYMIKGISSKLSATITCDRDSLTLLELIEKFILKTPDKITKFIANYILKSYAIEMTIKDNRFVSSSFNTFKSKKNGFEDIYKIIIEAYGSKYLTLVNPKIFNGDVEMQISNPDTNKKIIDSLAGKIKNLLLNKETEILTNDGKSHILKFSNNEQYIRFIVKNILYAIRNNTIHGKIASRLNSKYKNDASFESSKFVYLLGYLFLSLMLFVNDDLLAEDLCFNLENYKKL
ncbi:MAG: hypothetical protein WA099_08015 [Sulfuricurvum sp.]